MELDRVSVWGMLTKVLVGSSLHRWRSLIIQIYVYWCCLLSSTFLLSRWTSTLDPGGAIWTERYAMSWWIYNLERLEYHCHNPRGLVLPFISLPCDTIHSLAHSSLKSLFHPNASLTLKYVFYVTCIIHRWSGSLVDIEWFIPHLH